MKSAAATAPSASAMSGTNLAASQDEDVLCKYSHRACSQSTLDGHDFCLRHILEDKAAPYKQCAYMTKAGRKCPAAAPKLEKKEGFCSAHNRKSLLARQRLARKRRPGETGETLLEELVALTSTGSGSGGPGGSTQHEHRRNKMFTDSVASRALEYASSSDSESELGPLVEQTWRDDGDSDAESIDSDQEDLLKYAGAYTTEEVAQILRDKLIRLQALYIDQFKRLKHVLLVKRRQFLKSRGPEREAFGSVKLYKTDPQQKERYKKLRAMQHYHKKAGKEALLQRQSTERRIQASAESSGPLSPGRLVTGTPAKPAFPTCSFLDEGVLCGARAVPLSKFCQKHILHDSCQLLYRPCPFADSQCGRPVPTLLNTQFCSLHQQLPSGVKLEDEKDGSSDETKPNPSSSASHLTPKPADRRVKQEVKAEVDVLLQNCSGAATSRQSLGGNMAPTDPDLGQGESSGPVDAEVNREVKVEDGEEPNVPAASGAVDREGGMEEGKDVLIFTLGEKEEDEEDKQGR